MRPMASDSSGSPEDGKAGQPVNGHEDATEAPATGAAPAPDVVEGSMRVPDAGAREVPEDAGTDTVVDLVLDLVPADTVAGTSVSVPVRGSDGAFVAGESVLPPGC